MYAAARSWEISPSDFWDMTLGEWLLEADFRQDWNRKAQGKLTRAEEAELREWVHNG